jgi:acyl carrier protein
MSLNERVASVFAAVFGIAEASLKDDDSYETIADWDSVNHINLILALEAEFGVEFDPGEIAELGSVSAIRARLAASADA